MLFNAGAEAKIDEFGRLVLSQYNVFQLDVSVRNLLVVQIAEGCCQLLYDLLALGLGESLGGLLFE